MVNGIFEALAFIALVYLLYRYVWVRDRRGRGLNLAAAVEARQEAIRRQLEEARAARERLQQAEAEYRRALEQAKADAERIQDEARAEAGAIVADLRHQAEAEAERIRARGEASMDAERTATVAALRAEVGRLAADLAGELVSHHLSDGQAQNRVVDRFLATLESGTLPAAGGEG